MNQPASPTDRIAELEAELKAVKEDLAVANDLLKQKLVYDSAVQRDLRLWRLVKELARAILREE